MVPGSAVCSVAALEATATAAIVSPSTCGRKAVAVHAGASQRFMPGVGTIVWLPDQSACAIFRDGPMLSADSEPVSTVRPSQA
jgi:hypothetical protein